MAIEFLKGRTMNRKLLTIIAAVIFCLGSQAKAAENTVKGETMQEVKVSDYEAVKEALGKYLEAGRQGKSAVLRPAVYKDAIMYSAAGGKVEGGSINALFDYLDNNPAAPEIEAEITAVDVAGNIAYVKVESDKWHGARYTDMFLLVKDGSEWKILTKVFHTH